MVFDISEQYVLLPDCKIQLCLITQRYVSCYREMNTIWYVNGDRSIETNEGKVKQNVQNGRKEVNEEKNE